MPLFFEDDFAQAANGTFRAATDTESIRQDIVHLLSERDALAESATETFASELRGDIIDALSTNPAVQSIDRVDVTPLAGNGLSVAVAVNGNPLAITLTTGG